MAEYKLTYFNLRGLAEPIRLLFVYLDVPYENVELECKDWETLKKDIKWGQMPFLEHNGKVLTQSQAILNYVAERHNLSVEDAWKRAKCTEIIGATDDLRLALKPMVLVRYGGDLNKFEEMKPEVLPKLSVFLTNMNEILEEFHEPGKPTKTDFILGEEKPTAADFFLAHHLYQWRLFLGDPNLLEKYELLKKQVEAVLNLPLVDKHVKSRADHFI